MSVRVRRTAVVYLAVFVAAVLTSTTILGVGLRASKDERAADRASQQAQAQASIVADQRAAQTRRIDLLRAQVDDLRERLADQARTVGRQEQAIRDLAAQVQQSGGTPVVSAVVPKRDAARTPDPRPGSRPTSSKATTRPSTRPTTAPTTQPTRQPPVARPAPPSAPSNPGLVCGLLPLPILC